MGPQLSREGPRFFTGASWLTDHEGERLFFRATEAKNRGGVCAVGQDHPWVTVSDVASSANGGPTFDANTGTTLWGKTGLNSSGSRLATTTRVVIAN